MRFLFVLCFLFIGCNKAEEKIPEIRLSENDVKEIFAWKTSTVFVQFAEKANKELPPLYSENLEIHFQFNLANNVSRLMIDTKDLDKNQIAKLLLKHPGIIKVKFEDEIFLK